MTFAEIVKTHFVLNRLSYHEYTMFLQGYTELEQIRRDDLMEILPDMHIRILPTHVITDITE